MSKSTNVSQSHNNDIIEMKKHKIILEEANKKILFLTESLYDLIETGKTLHRLQAKVENEFYDIFLKSKKSKKAKKTE